MTGVHNVSRRPRRPRRQLGALVCCLLATLPVLGLAAVASPTPAAAAQAKPHIRWLAAGDSYSAGEGLPHSVGDCARAEPGSGSKSWAQVAYEHLTPTNAVYDEPNLVACTGAVTSNFLHDKDNAGSTEWNPSMGTYDLVTFTFGGNDVGFAGIIEACLGATLSPPPTDGLGHWCPRNADVRATIAAFAATERNFLKEVAKTVVTPGGNIVVLGYPEFIELPKFWHRWQQDFGLCWGINSADANELRGLAGDLNATIGQAVKDIDATAPNRVHLRFVDVNSGGNGIARDNPNLFEPSSGARHNLCSTGQPWMNGVNEIDAWPHGKLYPQLRGSFHPKQAGIDAEGMLAAATIGKLDWNHLAPPPVGYGELASAPVPSLCTHPAGTLVAGKLPGIAQNGGEVTFSHSLNDGAAAFALGDLNGDGSGDAAAVIECDKGGVPWPNSVQFYTNGPHGITRLGGVSLDTLSQKVGRGQPRQRAQHPLPRRRSRRRGMGREPPQRLRLLLDDDLRRHAALPRRAGRGLQSDPLRRAFARQRAVHRTVRRRHRDRLPAGHPPGRASARDRPGRRARPQWTGHCYASSPISDQTWPPDARAQIGDWPPNYGDPSVYGSRYCLVRSSSGGPYGIVGFSQTSWRVWQAVNYTSPTGWD